METLNKVKDWVLDHKMHLLGVAVAVGVVLLLSSQCC